MARNEAIARQPVTGWQSRLVVALGEQLDGFAGRRVSQDLKKHMQVRLWPFVIAGIEWVSERRHQDVIERWVADFLTLRGRCARDLLWQAPALADLVSKGEMSRFIRRFEDRHSPDIKQAYQ